MFWLASLCRSQVFRNTPIIGSWRKADSTLGISKKFCISSSSLHSNFLSNSSRPASIAMRRVWLHMVLCTYSSSMANWSQYIRYIPCSQISALSLYASIADIAARCICFLVHSLLNELQSKHGHISQEFTIVANKWMASRTISQSWSRYLLLVIISIRSSCMQSLHMWQALVDASMAFASSRDHLRMDMISFRITGSSLWSFAVKTSMFIVSLRPLFDHWNAHNQIFDKTETFCEITQLWLCEFHSSRNSMFHILEAFYAKTGCNWEISLFGCIKIKLICKVRINTDCMK